MEITIITSPFALLPPYGFGAVERRWDQIALILVKYNNSVTFITKSVTNKQKSEYRNGVKIKYIKGYIRSGSIKRDIIKDLLYSFRAFIALDKTDILIMNTFWTPILSILFKRKFKISTYNVARFPKHQFKYYKKIDRLYCVSSAVYNALIKQTPYAAKQAIKINNPVNTEIFFYQRKVNIENKPIRVIYSGRIHPEKGLIILVRAINYLTTKYQNLELALIGPRSIDDGGGGDTYVNELNKNATNFEIEYVNPVADPVLLSDAIAKSDIFCYPSIAKKGETFGVAPLEAMATGTPTIVSDLDCFKDFVVDGINGLIFNHRSKDAAKSLADRIKILIDDINLRDRLGIEGAKTALNFSNEIIAKKYLEDFKLLFNR